jgi:predicted PurR-regulated permease PerM
MDPVKQRTFRHVEQLLGVGLLVLILAGCFVVLRPFISVILWATILCYATWPACEWLTQRLGGRRSLAALIMTALLVVLMALPVVLLGSSLASGIEHLARVVRRLRVEGLPDPPPWITRLPFAGDDLAERWADLARNADRTAALLNRLLSLFQGWLLRHGLHIGQGLTQVCLSVVVAFFFYRDGHVVARGVTNAAQRVVGEYTQHLIDVASKTVRGVVYGVLGTALAQGIMAAIGFSIADLPAPVFWALLVSLLSFLPVGPPLVWIGATVWLALQDSVGRAVFMAIWGLLGISGIDNIIRPFIISRNAKLSFLPVFLGVLGGVAAFGLIGIFIGPTLLAVGMSIAREFATAGRHAPAETPPAAAAAAPPLPPPGPAAGDVIAGSHPAAK